MLTMLSGAEPSSLEHATFTERLSYPVLGALMILAASWTSVGMTIKIVYGFDLSWAAGLGIMLFMFSFVLLLETIMLATLSNTVHGWILRLSLGFLLMLMQTLPMTVWFFQSNIDVYKQEWQIQSMKTHSIQMQAVYAVGPGQTQAKEAGTSLEQAVVARNEAKPTPAMTFLLDKITHQQQMLSNTEKEMHLKEQVLSKAREQLRILMLDKDAGHTSIQRLEGVVAVATKHFDMAYRELRGQRETLSKLQNEYESSAEQHNRYLEEQVQWRTQQSQMTTKRLNESQTQLDRAKVQYEHVTQEATKTKFFNDAAMLLKLTMSDIWIGSVCVFLMLIALLVDIMPLVAKQQLQKMPHAQKIQHVSLHELSELKLKSSQHQLSLSKQQWELEKVQWDIEQQRIALHMQQQAHKKPWYLRWSSV